MASSAERMSDLSKRARAKKDRRDSIVTAATRVFLQSGVQGATMDGIAREAGLSKGTLYLYFQNKDELFLSIALEFVEAIFKELRQVDEDEHQDGLAKFRVLMQTYIRYSLSHKSSFMVAISWLGSTYSVDSKEPLFSQYKSALARGYALAISALDSAVDDGSLKMSVSSTRFALSIWGAVLGLILVENSSEEVARRAPFPISTDDLGCDFLDLILAGGHGALPAPLSATSGGLNEVSQS